MKRIKLYSAICHSALALALALVANYSQAQERDQGDPPRDEAGRVFTMDNAAAANHVLAYRRSAGGQLQADGFFETGGRGTGSGLGSQGAVVLSENGRWLFVCNAGSDEISVFRVAPRTLVPTDKVSSGGKHPISLALHHNSLFVLNAGGQAGDKDNISGFVFFAGKLYPLADSTRGLSADSSNPAQVGFSSDGEVLVVTEKDTSVIDTFTVDNDGTIDNARTFQSSGQTPFGFAMRGRDLIVSEAFGGAPNASAVSSYHLDRQGDLDIISPSVATTETSACWIAVTGDGRFAYAANTGSGTISGYTLTLEGRLTLLNPDGVTGIIGAGSSPADLAISENGHFLYSRNGNGTISVFRINAGGSLTPRSGITGLPAGTTGIAAR
jgi:6-phosphogluconolactonase